MKIHELIITRSLLLHLKNLHQDERLLPVSDVFLNLLSRDELIAIIDLMTDGEHGESDPEFAKYEKAELLNFIADQYYILSYLIDRIEREVGI